MQEVPAAQVQIAAKLGECLASDRAGYLAAGGDVIDRRAGFHTAFSRFSGLEVLQSRFQQRLAGGPRMGFYQPEQMMVFSLAHQDRVFIVNQRKKLRSQCRT